MSERDVLHDIREALGQEPDLVLWRNGVGAGEFVEGREVQRALDLLRMGKTIDAAGLLTTVLDSARFAKYGLPKGSADIVGILTMVLEGELYGIFFALEVKSGRGRTSDEQDRWLALVRRMGGFATVVRSVQEAKEALARARKGESQ